MTWPAIASLLAAVLIIVGLFLLPGIVMWGVAIGLLLRGRSGGRGGVDEVGEVYDHAGYIDRGRQMFVPRYRSLVNGQMLTCNGTTATSWEPEASPAEDDGSGVED